MQCLKNMQECFIVFLFFIFERLKKHSWKSVCQYTGCIFWENTKTED